MHADIIRQTDANTNSSRHNGCALPGRAARRSRAARTSSAPAHRGWIRRRANNQARRANNQVWKAKNQAWQANNQALGKLDSTLIADYKQTCFSAATCHVRARTHEKPTPRELGCRTPRLNPLPCFAAPFTVEMLPRIAQRYARSVLLCLCCSTGTTLAPPGRVLLPERP
jgi:hypothetical protein